jgi:molybdopterin-guanine dinucleotide biosynthesis adapter protein
VKHASHGFELETPAKDSARATAAGARGVVLVGPAGLAYLEAGAAPTPEEAAKRFFAHADLVLVEGFSRSRVPTLVLHAAGGSDKKAPVGRVLAHLDATDVDARVVADLLVEALDLPVRARRVRRRRTR